MKHFLISSILDVDLVAFYRATVLLIAWMAKKWGDLE